MWRSGGGHGGVEKKGLVAVAIDKDKGSQFALRWAIDNLLSRGQTVVLIHVLQKQPNPINDSPASCICIYHHYLLSIHLVVCIYIYMCMIDI